LFCYLFVFLLPGFAGAVTENDFLADTTQQLFNLCTVSPDNPLYNQALGFCRGYLVGAWDYYEAQSSGLRPVGIFTTGTRNPKKKLMRKATRKARKKSKQSFF
jgi:hypothetical protein